MSDVLKDIKASYKRSDVLLPSLERHVLKKAAEPTERRPDVLHPSEMAKGSWCHRHDYYRIIGTMPDFKGKSHSFRMENVFAYGHMAHSKYQTWLWEMGILWGKWQCLDCYIGGTGLVPQECKNHPVPSKRIKYLEVPLEWGLIAGHSDGVLAMPDKDRMLEIKTVGIPTLRYDAPRLYEQYESEQWTPDEVWFRINRPFASHVRQGQLYMFLARMLYPALRIEEIIFLYEWKVTQEVKEFVVPYNPDTIKGVLEKADLVTEAIAAVEPPDRPENLKQEGKTCRECIYRATCWGTASEASVPQVRVKRATPAQRRRALRS